MSPGNEGKTVPSLFSTTNYVPLFHDALTKVQILPVIISLWLEV